MKKIGIVAIIINGSREVVPDVQNILSDFADIIVSRNGNPDHEHQIFVISVVVKGTPERLSALTGRLGRLDTVKVKSAITAVEVDD